jgi:hypothetical protein
VGGVCRGRNGCRGFQFNCDPGGECSIQAQEPSSGPALQRPLRSLYLRSRLADPHVPSQLSSSVISPSAKCKKDKGPIDENGPGCGPNVLLQTSSETRCLSGDKGSESVITLASGRQLQTKSFLCLITSGICIYWIVPGRSRMWIRWFPIPTTCDGPGAWEPGKPTTHSTQ